MGELSPAARSEGDQCWSLLLFLELRRSRVIGRQVQGARPPKQVSGSYQLRLMETWMLPNSSPTLPLGGLVCQEAAGEGRKKATGPSTEARPLPPEFLHVDAAGPRPGAAPLWVPGSHRPTSSSGWAQGWLGSGTVEDM